MNRQDLIARLNEHLTAEITATKIYTAVAERLEDLDLSLLLKTTAAEEGEHGGFLPVRLNVWAGRPSPFKRCLKIKFLK